ncbi:MAG: 30S ribosomal protein S16 [Candidatus Omnitrophota bacterium]
MAVVLRLKRMGTNKKPFYRIVATENTNPRDGRFIEEIGHYDPKTDPADIKIDKEKALRWLKNGAKPSTTVKSLLAKQGIK